MNLTDAPDQKWKLIWEVTMLSSYHIYFRDAEVQIPTARTHATDCGVTSDLDDQNGTAS
jgi:hypothetical protein